MKRFWKVGVGLLVGVSLSACALSGPTLEVSAQRSGIVWRVPTLSPLRHPRLKPDTRGRQRAGRTAAYGYRIVFHSGSARPSP